MLNFESILKSAEAEISQSQALKRVVQAGILFSLLRTTVRRYTGSNSPQLNDATVRLFEAVTKAGIADDLFANVLDGHSRDPEYHIHTESPTEDTAEPVGDVPQGGEEAIAQGDFHTITEDQIRAMAKMYNWTPEETQALLKAHGLLQVRDFDPTADYGKPVVERTDEDLALEEARKESELAGIRGFGIQPEDLLNHEDHSQVPS